MKGIVSIMVMLSVLTGLKAQDAQSVIDKTRLIADKIIRETSFDYTTKGLSSNGGWSQVRIPAINKEGQFVAYAVLNSEKEANTYLGLCYEGNISLYLNGEKIFTGESDSLELSEYTYNRYNIQKTLPVLLRKGENKITVLCKHYERTSTIMLMPVNELDMEETFASMVILVSDPVISEWLISGPYSSNTTLEDILQPHKEEDGKQYNSKDYHGWELPSVPLLKELYIAESNSYKRDSYAEWHYANGGTMLGVLNLYSISNDDSYLDFVSKYAENILENRAYFQWQYQHLHALRGSFYKLMRMTMLDDSGGPVLPFAQMKLINPERNYDPLLNEVLDYVVNREHRLEDRTLCRPEPEPNTIWADDLFMSVPFLCRMARITGDVNLYDEVATQVIQFNNYLQEKETGLYHHGWYADRSEPAPILWGRANGWVTWAMSEALILIPEDHPGYKRILRIFRDHIQAVAEYQDGSGMWHQVLNHPETYEETSCTAMFTLALARGVRYGWLKKAYGKNAMDGWNALGDKIGEDGTVVGICRGTEIGGSVEFYNARQSFDHDPRGLGAMLTAGTEIHLLLQSSHDTGSD
ncbi:glycoside hydrolase family 105 protein [Bacteroidota bacterium]